MVDDPSKPVKGPDGFVVKTGQFDLLGRPVEGFGETAEGARLDAARSQQFVDRLRAGNVDAQMKDWGRDAGIN